MTNNKLLDMAPSIFESLHDFIVVDKEGIVVFISQDYAAFLGKTQENIIGRYVADVIPGTRLPIILETGKEELGSFVSVTNSENNKILSSVCNRLPIWKEGKVNGEVIGAMAEAVVCVSQDINRLYSEVEMLRNQNKQYKMQIAKLCEAKHNLNNILGNSSSIIELKTLIQKVANSSISVTINGETGTGKELVASAIHRLSKRCDQPFVKINCAAIPKELMESELFGYEHGAFTGAANKGKMGKFELANKGTILLDEIGEMPLILQSKLLRVLQEKEIERIGGTKPIKLDERIICSTNRDLADMVNQGLFREDLYYRINVMEVTVQPLRERFEDLPILCEHFIEKNNRENGINITGINKDVYTFFKTYSWRGNVRELEHAMERACVMLGSGELQVEHFNFLLPRMVKNIVTKEKIDSGSTSSLRDCLNQSEREEILKALEKTQGNKSATAKLLKVDRSALYNKLKKYNIEL